ncbi:MAG: hypothetical protein KF912_03140 [Phycisphaeraceae bacterium]|nr:hypothetical protein [Phycisphaeraceae bacterium]
MTPTRLSPSPLSASHMATAPSASHRGLPRRKASSHRHTLPLVLLALCVIGLGACRKKPNTYDQSTPEAVLASAKAMVANGDTRRLTELIQADTKEMRALWDRIGYLCGDLADLGVQLNASFPQEIAEIKRKAASGEMPSSGGALLSQITGGQRAGQRPGARRGPPGRGQPTQTDPSMDPSRDPRGAINDAMRQILADPFAWLGENSERLSVTPINDEMAAMLWDNKPIFPPVGIVIQRSAYDDKWYLAPPIHLPPMNQLLPKTADEYAIWMQLIDAFRNVLIDMRKDVAAGKMRDIEEVSRAAGERAFIPVAFIGVAYSKAMEERRRAEREARRAASEANAPATTSTGRTGG